MDGIRAGQMYRTDENKVLFCIELEYGGGNGVLEPTFVILSNGACRFKRTPKEVRAALKDRKLELYDPPWKK